MERLEHSEMRKSSKDCYISFEGNRYSIPYQYSCRDLAVKLRGEELGIFYGDELFNIRGESYRLRDKRKELIREEKKESDT